MMRRHVTFISAAALAAMLALAGCGNRDFSNPSEATAPILPPDADRLVGIAECYSCHSDAANPAGIDTVFGDSQASLANGIGWLSGPHGNYEAIDMFHNVLDLGPDNNGFPYYGYGDFNDADCGRCHNELGDALGITALYQSTGIDAIGRVARPVIGCESCHGAGDEHFGQEPPRAFRSPSFDVCGKCHNEDFDHNAYHPEADSIFEQYSASRHAASINEHVIENEDDARGLCSRCHTDQGVRKYMDTPIGSLYTAPFQNNPAPVQCRTCHDAHNPFDLLRETTVDTGTGKVYSAEYNTCTTCHQTSGALHGQDSADSWGPQDYPYSVGVGNFDSAEIIYDTHMDNPGTPDIEGYVLNESSPRVCRDCHNVHSADITINEQWAKSAHGGFILEKKGSAFANTSSAADPYADAIAILNGTNTLGSVTEDDAAAWVHYDFKAANRAACQRCHTSTGFRNLAAAPTTYDADGNGTPDSSNIYNAVDSEKELLYCWACHKDNAGGLRSTFSLGGKSNPLLFANVAPYSEPASRIGAVPDVKGSNVCLSCHSGRESGGGIEASTANFTNTSFMNSHYLAAGGTMFRTIGYEYATLDYGNPVYYAHDRIGVTVTGSAGQNGPCVGCHMRSEEGHSLEAVITDGTGAITNVPVFDNTCTLCHAGTEAEFVASLNSLKAGFDAAMDELSALLAASGIYFRSAYPYFYMSAYDPAYVEDHSCSKNLAVYNWLTGGSNAYVWDPSAGGGSGACVKVADGTGAAGTGKDNMGAAFNYNMLHHEPGAFAHNARYARRLIYDSIDHMDDGLLNGSVSSAFTNSAALTYLNSGMRP